MPDWRESIQTVISVIRHRKTKGKKTVREEAFFISDLPPSKWAAYFGKYIREHWKIENCLHYSKDVSLWEDYSKIRTWNQPHNISLFRTMALNILRDLWYTNMAQAIRLIQHDIPRMASLLI